MSPRLTAAGVLLLSSFAFAKAAGIPASSCSGCHGGGLALQQLQVQVQVQNPSLAVNGSTPITVTLGSALTNGGLYVTSDGKGTLSPGAGMKSLGAGLSHSTPKAASNGQVSFTFTFTATGVPDGTDLTVVALGGNGDNRSAGDKTGEVRLSLVWGCTGVTWYADFDGDGHGTAANGTTVRCNKPSGYSSSNDDCDDNNELVYGGAMEACNGKDDNCNGQVDEGITSTTTWPDADHDGYGDFTGASMVGCAGEVRAPNHDDCNDHDGLVKPSGVEVCNAKDDNCDGRVDENVRARCGEGWCARLSPTCDPLLCMPGDPVSESCNGLDDDCDGLVDDGPLCPGGVCFEGNCVETDPALSPDAGPFIDEPTPPKTQGCQSAPGLFAALALLAWRRSRAFRR